jgi:hypothetical protein
VLVFYRWLNRELAVDMGPGSFIGSSICDHQRVLEFANFYFMHGHLHPYFRGELAELVWDSIDEAFSRRQPTNKEIEAVKRVVMDAVSNDYFIGEKFILHLARCGALHEHAMSSWLLSLDGVDVKRIEEETARGRRERGEPM